MRKRYPIKQVPCNGCTICCQHDAVRLEGKDSSFEYQTEPHPYLSGALMLAHKPNGECIYLANNGCSIHDHAPTLCRIADCRSLAVRFDYETARQLHSINRLDIRVWDQGQKLIEKMAAQNAQENIYYGKSYLPSNSRRNESGQIPQSGGIKHY
jgi:hypothetical protein